MKKSKNPKKQRHPKNREKRQGQKWNNIQSSTQRASFDLCLRVLISALLLIIFVLFTSLDISGTWNVNRSATKRSIRDTYSASSSLEIFILAKNQSQDPLYVVTNFLSILSISSKFSTGYAFHLFNLIFYVVTSFMLLSEEKYQKNKKKKLKFPKKNNNSPKNRKKIGPKEKQYLEEHIESVI